MEDRAEGVKKRKRLVMNAYESRLCLFDFVCVCVCVCVKMIPIIKTTL